MQKNFKLQQETTALIVIDVQEKLFEHIERPCEVLLAMQKIIKGFHILKLPVFVSEQYPQGLGHTIGALKSSLKEHQTYYAKTCFSCLGDGQLREIILSSPIRQWVLVGIESHVCVLQTAKDLLSSGMQVIVLNDAISSRSIYDYSTAIAEMRDIGVRISSVETILFELVHDSVSPEFKQISQLVKS